MMRTGGDHLDGAVTVARGTLHGDAAEVLRLLLVDALAAAFAAVAAPDGVAVEYRALGDCRERAAQDEIKQRYREKDPDQLDPSAAGGARGGC
jgi:hypothetical protein